MTVFAKSNSTETVRPIVVTFQDRFNFGRLRCSLLLPYSNSGQVTRFKPTASVYSRTFEVDGSFGTSSLTNTNEHASTNNPFSSHFLDFQQRQVLLLCASSTEVQSIQHSSVVPSMSYICKQFNEYYFHFQYYLYWHKLYQ